MKKIFYYLIISPVIAKVLEWVVFSKLFAGGDYFIFSKMAWLIQIIFLILLSLGVYGSFKFLNKNRYEFRYEFIVPIAYLLKEIYNYGFVYKAFNYSMILEPIIIYLVLGFIPTKILKVKWLS